MPRGRRKIDSTEVDIAQSPALDIPDTLEDVGGPLIDVIEGPDAGDHAEKLAFYEEMVGINMMDTNDPKADPVPGIGVNNRTQYFIRGMNQKVRRKYVAKLATMKPVSYKQQTHINPNTGDKVYKMVPNAALKYPFTVINDPNPKGADWLRNLLQQSR